MIGELPEKYRRAASQVAQWGGWLGAIALHAWATAAYETPPPQVTFYLIFLIGVGVAGTLVRSRMRMTRTIVQAFRTGQSSDERIDAIERKQREISAQLDEILDRLDKSDE